jgi:hypothetical protein
MGTADGPPVMQDENTNSGFSVNNHLRSGSFPAIIREQMIGYLLMTTGCSVSQRQDRHIPLLSSPPP